MAKRFAIVGESDSARFRIHTDPADDSSRFRIHSDTEPDPNGVTGVSAKTFHILSESPDWIQQTNGHDCGPLVIYNVSRMLGIPTQDVGAIRVEANENRRSDSQLGEAAWFELNTDIR